MTEARYDVLGIGSAIVDIIAQGIGGDGAVDRQLSVKVLEFVKSLADQYAKKGELSQKQLWYVGRLYRKYSDKNYWLRQALLGHNWQQVGFIVHHYNTVLGTFSSTNYHKCSKCGLDGETTESNNYSGD